MARAIGVGDLRIVFRPLIGVLDHQADRRARRLAFEDARQDPDRIGFLTLGRELVLPGFARIEEGLDVAFSQREAGGAPVDHRSDGGAVAFAPGGEAQHASEGVPAHAVVLAQVWPLSSGGAAKIFLHPVNLA